MNTRLVSLTAIILLLFVSACGGGAQAASSAPSPDRFPTVPPFATVALMPTVPPFATVPALENRAAHATATPGAAAVDFIDQMTLTKDVKSDTYEPIGTTDTFASNDPYIHFVVHLKDAPAQTNLKATLLQGDMIDLATLSATTPDAGSRFADFRFTPPSGGWETGDYSVVLYVNDQLYQAVTFTVK